MRIHPDVGEERLVPFLGISAALNELVILRHSDRPDER